MKKIITQAMAAAIALAPMTAKAGGNTFVGSQFQSTDININVNNGFRFGIINNNGPITEQITTGTPAQIPASASDDCHRCHEAPQVVVTHAQRHVMHHAKPVVTKPVDVKKPPVTVLHHSHKPKPVVEMRPLPPIVAVRPAPVANDCLPVTFTK